MTPSMVPGVRIPTRNSLLSPFELSTFLSTNFSSALSTRPNLHSQTYTCLSTPSRPCRFPCTIDPERQVILQKTTLSAFFKVDRPYQPGDSIVLFGTMLISTNAYRSLFVCKRGLNKLAARSLSHVRMSPRAICISAYAW